MFYSLTGKLILKSVNYAVVECGGVGFKCYCSGNTLSFLTEKDTVTLYTHLSVREDAMELFGFYDESELEVFKLLISISGVGPKAALGILSVLTIDKLILAIGSSDVKAITKAPGVGAKIANRIVTELKDKVAKDFITSGIEDFEVVTSFKSDGKTDEAVAALSMLGYSRSEAMSAVSKVDTSGSVEDIIKLALKAMM